MTLPPHIEQELRDLGVLAQTAPKPAAHAEVTWPKVPDWQRSHPIWVPEFPGEQPPF